MGISKCYPIFISLNCSKAKSVKRLNKYIILDKFKKRNLLIFNKRLRLKKIRQKKVFWSVKKTRLFPFGYKLQFGKFYRQKYNFIQGYIFWLLRFNNFKKLRFRKKFLSYFLWVVKHRSKFYFGQNNKKNLLNVFGLQFLKRNYIYKKSRFNLLKTVFRLFRRFKLLKKIKKKNSVRYKKFRHTWFFYCMLYVKHLYFKHKRLGFFTLYSYSRFSPKLFNLKLNNKKILRKKSLKFSYYLKRYYKRKLFKILSYRYLLLMRLRRLFWNQFFIALKTNKKESNINLLDLSSFFIKSKFLFWQKIFNYLVAFGFYTSVSVNKWSPFGGIFLLSLRYKIFVYNVEQTIWLLRRFFFFIERSSYLGCRFMVVFHNDIFKKSWLKILKTNKYLWRRVFFLSRLKPGFLSNYSCLKMQKVVVPDIILFLDGDNASFREINRLGFPLVGKFYSFMESSSYFFPLPVSGGLRCLFILWGIFLHGLRLGSFRYQKSFSVGFNNNKKRFR